ncbi:EF-hand [Russula ochroleuca]|uniref:EF-hand n=1 Tax=Russula ochroleuca TaxID=152965 RepID=A0A9P5MUT0_9AGAM|nr:EF-hand [Russula ochroleuca]
MYGSNYGGGYHHAQSSNRNHQSPNQFNQGYPSGPYNADPQLWQWFNAVDTDRSGSISVAELQAALVNGNWSRFDLDTVKMLMNMFDTDRNGTINFQEFTGLWKYITDWQGVFRHFDRDRSGTIDGHELSEALRNFGYPLPPSLLTLLEHKYASGPSTGYGASSGITFDRFVRACVAVKTLREAFQRADTDRDEWITISYEEFMRIVLSAP